MSTMSERIDAGLTAKSMDASGLAEILGISKQFVSDIKSGKTPGRKHVPKIADALGCSVEWLTTGTGSPPMWWLGHQVGEAFASARLDPAPAAVIEATDRELPVLGRVAANSDRWGEIEQPDLRHHRIKKSLALVQVMGDSAYPVAFPGQFVVVDTDRPIRDQNLVVVVLQDGRALLKRYCAIPGEPNRMLLASVNIGLGSLLINRSEVRYLHPVVGVMFE